MWSHLFLRPLILLAVCVLFPWLSVGTSAAQDESLPESSNEAIADDSEPLFHPPVVWSDLSGEARVEFDAPEFDPSELEQAESIDSLPDSEAPLLDERWEQLPALFEFQTVEESSESLSSDTPATPPAPVPPKPHKLCTDRVFPYLCGDENAPDSKRCCYNGIADKCETTKEPGTGQIIGTCSSFCNLRYMYPCGAKTCCSYNQECFKGGVNGGFCGEPCFLAGALCGFGKGSRCCKSFETCQATNDPKKPYACLKIPQGKCTDAKPPGYKCGSGCCILTVDVCHKLKPTEDGKQPYACCPNGTTPVEDPKKPGEYLCNGIGGPKCGEVGGQEYQCPSGFTCCATELRGNRPLCCPNDSKCDNKNRRCIPGKDPKTDP